MVSITSKTADINGFFVFDELPSSEKRNGISRLSRAATLDGAGVLDNQGFSHSDRTLRFEADLTAEQADALWSFYKSHLEFNISFDDGFYEGAIERVYIDRNPTLIVFYIDQEVT